MKRLNLTLFFLAIAAAGVPAWPLLKGKIEKASPLRGEPIVRLHNHHLKLPPQEKKEPWHVPWNEGGAKHLPKITKEFFRCKGSSLNPERIIERNGKQEKLTDCGGYERHSLPLRDQKEFIYPILLNLLNHIQNKTGKKVVITAGHRCPEHNTYVDASKQNISSKHMIGAEVSFYVQDIEDQLEIVELLKRYYVDDPEHQGLPEYCIFQRYEKTDTNVSTPPWFNKEIFIKYFKKNEGRNFDNRHPYPYISIQVRYDRDMQERVVYSWDLANKNYLRR